MNYEKETRKLEEKGLLESWSEANSHIAGAFVIFVLAVFPLVFHDRYADILRAKYWVYLGACIAMLLALLITTVYFLCKDARHYSWAHVCRLRSGWCWRKIGAPCAAMLAFAAVTAVSTFQSEYFYESFWGNEGRYSGLFLTMFYGASFLVVSKCLRYRRLYLDLFLTGGLAVGFLGILHYFKIDPIGIKEGLDTGAYNMFFSTIGNANTYTAYLALLAAVSTLLYLVEDGKSKRRYYLLSTAVFYMALITGLSDNAYLSLGVLFGALPLYLFKNIKGIRQYVFLITLFFTELWTVGQAKRLLGTRALDLGGIFGALTESWLLSAAVLVLWLTVGILYLRHGGVEGGEESRAAILLRRAWIGLLAAVLLGIGFILADANLFGHEERYEAVRNYVVFSDSWGTLRGLAWRMALECFGRFPLIHKLFGFGPDTFGILTTQSYLEEMYATSQIFENAHNEYLQYLVTLGIAGLTAYLAVLIAGIRQLIRRAARKPEFLAIAFAIGCYSAQAAVNLNVLIVVPVMLTLLAVGTAGAEAAARS